MKTKPKPKGTSLAAALMVIVLIISIFSLGFYSSNGGKVTGEAVGITGATIKEITVEGKTFYYDTTEYEQKKGYNPTPLYLDSQKTKIGKSWITTDGSKISRQPEEGETRTYATIPVFDISKVKDVTPQVVPPSATSPNLLDIPPLGAPAPGTPAGTPAATGSQTYQIKMGSNTYTVPKEVYNSLKDTYLGYDAATNQIKTKDGSTWTHDTTTGSWTKTSETTENFGTEKIPNVLTTGETSTTYATDGKISGSKTTTYAYDSKGTKTKTTTDVYDYNANTKTKTIEETTAGKTTTTVITYDANTGEPKTATVNGVADASVLKWARVNWKAGQIWDALESAARGGIGKFFSLFMKDEDLEKWQEDVDEFLCSTIIAGGIECWTSEICNAYSETNGDGYVSIETNGLLTMAAHIEGERTRMEYVNETTGENVVEYIYKVTYKVTNPSNSKEKMDFNVYLYGDKTVALYPGSVNVGEGDSSSRTASSAVVQDSKYNYDKVCIIFDESVSMVNEDITEVCNNINEYGGESVPYEGEAREGSTSAGGTGDYGGAGTEVDF